MDTHNFNQSNILLAKAVSYKRPKPRQEFAGCRYDFELGLWIGARDGIAYVDGKERRPPETKKADAETGEDQKGE
jgi:hypothetical protein